jgi:hypothetical protein
MIGSRRTARTSHRILGVVAGLAAVCAVGVPGAGAAWSVAPGTVPSNTSATTDVYCTTASSCLLVGFQSGVATSELAASWNGTAFSALTPSSSTSELYGTTCSPTLCWAVGADFAGAPVPHAETYNGSTWTTTSMPNPSGSTDARAIRVACPTSSDCFAVGYDNPGGADFAFIEHWDGTSWSLQSLSLPGTMVGSKLLGVACTSGSACTAVGFIEVTGQPRKTLVMTWNGSAWSVQTSANPSGAALSELTGVACPSAGACMAAGEYIDGSSVQHSLAEELSGGTWTLRSVPDPASGGDPVMHDVACVSSNSCEAVGQYTSTTPNTEPLAAGWNGSTWTLQSVPKATGTSDALMTGVACPSTCMATGLSIYDGSIGITGMRPLVELGP